MRLPLSCRFLKRYKAARSDELSPSLFKRIENSSETDEIPEDWFESIIVPICKNSGRSSYQSHRIISLENVASKMFADVILDRLSSSHERCMPETRASFLPGRVVLTNFPFVTDLRTSAYPIDPQFLSLLT